MRAACASVGVGILLLATAGAGTAASQPTIAPGIGQATPATGTAIIRGAVLAADTGAPVRRAQVRASSMDGRDTRVTLTDDQGRFELKDLVGGRYSVTVSRSGFVTLQYGQRRPNERGTPVEVAPGGVVDRIAVGLPRGGVITGRLTDEMGDPLADAQVQVMRSTFTPSGRRLMPGGRMDTTDDQGSFRLHGLAPGEYVVVANVRNQTMIIGPPGTVANVDQGYAPTYYPGTPAMSDAQRIVVGLGQEVSGIVFAMTPTRVARITGRVTGGKPGDYDGFVSLTPEDMSAGMGLGGGAGLQSDGTFEMTGVAPGRYNLRVMPRGNRRDEDLVGLLPITVAGADLTGLVIPLHPPARIMGRIEFEGGMPPGTLPSQVRVFPSPVNPLGMGAMMSGPPRTNADFTFVVSGITQPVMLRSGGLPGWSLKAVLVDGEDLTDTPFDVAAGSTVTGVRVILTRVTTTLSGVVRDDRGNASSSAAIVVFPGDDDKLGPQTRYLRWARPDLDGRYEIRGLPAYANYRIVAVESLEDGQIYDPDFLGGLRDRAERLALSDGETKTHDLRLRQ